MFNLFYQGGTLFMSVLTLIFLWMLILVCRNGVRVFQKEGSYTKSSLHLSINYIKAIGLFALVFGILGQLIGLYSAFATLETGTNISPAMLAGGLRVSMITTLYGFFIYVLSYVFWLMLSWRTH